MQRRRNREPQEDGKSTAQRNLLYLSFRETHICGISGSKSVLRKESRRHTADPPERTQRRQPYFEHRNRHHAEMGRSKNRKDKRKWKRKA
nr:MAG TPA: hypothetical protein [Caudoviricetes sp.]